jgi:hypothetical protein
MFYINHFKNSLHCIGLLELNINQTPTSMMVNLPIEHPNNVQDILNSEPFPEELLIILDDSRQILNVAYSKNETNLHILAITES